MTVSQMAIFILLKWQSMLIVASFFTNWRVLVGLKSAIYEVLLYQVNNRHNS